MAVIKYVAAKINILLDITSVFDNGYHAVYSIMQSVSLYDRVSAEKNSLGAIRLSCSDPAIPADGSNTAHKAARLFFERIGTGGVDIHIEKKIPAGGGLAGGSADAAGTLAALNELFGAGLTENELCETGAKVGADVPFCLRGGTMLAQNIGDVLSPLPALPDCHILLVKPRAEVSTAGAYKAYDAKDWIRHPDKDRALKAAVEGDLRELCRRSANVFEQVIEIPGRIELKAVMRRHGALHAFMTGSGSVICGIFEKENAAKECMAELSVDYPEIFLTVPVTRGVKN